jgi:hypothetical protein
MVKAYENRIRKLETDKAVLIEKSSQSLHRMRSYDAVLRTAQTSLYSNRLLIVTDKKINWRGRRDSYNPLKAA